MITLTVELLGVTPTEVHMPLDMLDLTTSC